MGKDRIKANHLSASARGDRGFAGLQLQLSGKKSMESGNDMKAANETYGGFTVLLKWGTIISAIVAAIVVVLIA